MLVRIVSRVERRVVDRGEKRAVKRVVRSESSQCITMKKIR
jgi:hypothetical protein